MHLLADVVSRRELELMHSELHDETRMASDGPTDCSRRAAFGSWQ
jgi:hypothetical protein